MDNNLFTYATKELSQDAFICWLLSFAVKGCEKDPALKACAQDFLRAFIGLEQDEEVFLSRAPQKQYKHIDVLLTINDRYKVIVEDKTGTSEHNNQLEIYRNTVKEEFPEPEYKIIGIYFKTGYQSDYSKVTAADYKLFLRERILAILEKHADTIDNDIFQDYYSYLAQQAKTAGRYKELPITEWGGNQVYAFYDDCKKKLEYTNMQMQYGYVPNRSGGFDAMWIYHPDCFVTFENVVYEMYLQCEFLSGDLKIRYRASAREEKIHGKSRDRLIWKKENGKWVDVAECCKFKKSGSRYGSGKSVALGEYAEKSETAQEALMVIKHAILDFQNLVRTIKEEPRAMENVKI